jgi:RNA polymerase sigma factor (sigma-70 family)
VVAGDVDGRGEDLEPSGPPADLLAQLEQEQTIREAITSLPPRCRQLIAMLFFEQPPIPYAEVAKTLNLATGSIGFIRGRCLKRLRHVLEEKGF